MIHHNALTCLSKAKLNITWDDDETDARVSNILAEAVPTVCNMIGLSYDYGAQEALDENGDVFDFSDPSLERNVLMNYVAYEWNHQSGMFRDAYWQEIAACRQRHELLEDALTEDGEDDDNTGSE